MNKTHFETRMQIIIGNAKKSGATEEEIDILVKAFGLAQKYWPVPKKAEG